MNNHLSPEIIECKKRTTYGDENPGPDLRQAQQRGGIKPVETN